MEKKRRFTKPEITRIKLDPEQAILAYCIDGGFLYTAPGGGVCVHGIAGKNACYADRIYTMGTSGSTYTGSTGPS